MKVIKNNHTTNKGENKNIEKQEKSIFPMTVICENCGSELVIEKEDTYIGWLGAYHYTCPCCNTKNMLDELEGVTLTQENIQFPKHFHRTVHGKNCIHVDEEKVTQMIRDLIKEGEYNDSFSVSSEYGDLHISVTKLDVENDYKEYYVVVTQDYYSTYVACENNDYDVEYNVCK